MVKSLLSCKATVCRSGISNSTFSPSVLMYQLRERARSVTGILRWSNLIMSRHLQRVTVLANASAQPPGPLAETTTLERLGSAPVGCSVLFGTADLTIDDRRTHPREATQIRGR